MPPAERRALIEDFDRTIHEEIDFRMEGKNLSEFNVLMRKYGLVDVKAPAPVEAMVTERVDKDTVWMPFHFSGRWQGADMLAYYPKGAAPVVRGEAVNTATTYGYDSVTMMQETKTTVCNIEKA